MMILECWGFYALLHPAGSTRLSYLSKVEPEEISRRGKADLSTGNGALKCARVILEKYNGRRGGRKLAYKFSG